MAYSFVTQQKASAIITESGTTDTYKIAGVNGKQTNAGNFQKSIVALLHIVGKDTTAGGTGRTITQDVQDTFVDPQFTATPNSFSLYDVRGTSTKTLRLDYLGDARTVTASGYKPKGGTIEFDGKNVTIAGGNFLFNEGDISHTMTLTLAATDEYSESAIEITMTADNESSFEQIEE